MKATTLPEPVSKVDFKEIGSTGLKRYGGEVEEEFLRDLQGIRKYRAYTEMRDNDDTVGAILFAFDLLIRQSEWRVQGEDEELVEFVDGCMGDMSHSWEATVTEILSMFPFGFSLHEICYKKRDGLVLNDDRKPSSKFSDGKYGWRKIPIRAQETIEDWLFDDEGGIQGAVQVAPPNFNPKKLPINRCLLFRTGLHKGNPEGRSLLRNAYRPWVFKKRLENYEAIGMERDLAGMPVIYRSADIADKWDTELKKIVTGIKRDEQEGILLPLVYDEDGNKLLTFELLSSPGTRQLNISDAVNRYKRAIATTVLADFIYLGQEKVGSFALSSSKTELFSLAVRAILNSIAEVFNRHAIPRLMSANGWMNRDHPYLVPGDVEVPNLKELGDFISAMTGSGASMFPDDELENHLRRLADLPEKSEQEQEEEPPMIPGYNPPQEEPDEEEGEYNPLDI